MNIYGPPAQRKKMARPASLQRRNLQSSERGACYPQQRTPRAAPGERITCRSPGAAPSARSGRGKCPAPFWTSGEVFGTNPAPVDLLVGASGAPPSAPIPADLVRAATGREQIGRKLGGRSGSLIFAKREWVCLPINLR